jgi:carbon monoxide dehydrogenase subunit G
LPGGVPVVTLTVTAKTYNATGSVTSNPAGIQLQGAGTASSMFAHTVTLTAAPKGAHVRVRFSGNCRNAHHLGDLGEGNECLVSSVPDPNVTVTLTCREGFTCDQ